MAFRSTQVGNTTRSDSPNEKLNSRLAEREVELAHAEIRDMVDSPEPLISALLLELECQRRDWPRKALDDPELIPFDVDLAEIRHSILANELVEHAHRHLQLVVPLELRESTTRPDRSHPSPATGSRGSGSSPPRASRSRARVRIANSSVVA
jgi:hypothetical protein